MYVVQSECNGLISADHKELLELLKTVFHTLTVAMRFEPANAKFFATEVGYIFFLISVRV